MRRTPGSNWMGRISAHFRDSNTPPWLDSVEGETARNPAWDLPRNPGRDARRFRRFALVRENPAGPLVFSGPGEAEAIAGLGTPRLPALPCYSAGLTPLPEGNAC